MHTISAEWTIPFKDIADNDLNLIARTILPMNDEMEKQFAINMYAVVGAAAEKVGNVVSARAAGSFSQSMLEMFKKIELGAIAMAMSACRRFMSAQACSSALPTKCRTYRPRSKLKSSRSRPKRCERH
jgi:hypothetical protein